MAERVRKITLLMLVLLLLLLLFLFIGRRVTGRGVWVESLVEGFVKSSW